MNRLLRNVLITSIIWAGSPVGADEYVPGPEPENPIQLAKAFQNQDAAAAPTLPPIEVRPPIELETPELTAPVESPSPSDLIPDPVVLPPMPDEPTPESPSTGQETPMVAPELAPTPVQPPVESPAPVTNPMATPPSTPPTSPSRAPTSARSNAPYSQAFKSLSESIFGGGPTDPTGLNSILRTERDLFETTQLGTIVDRQDLDRRQATSMFRALQNEVGVTLQQTGNGQLSPFIRGLTGQQILVLIDGIRMNTSILRPGPNQYAATIDPGTIDRIEIIRGAESAMWGSDAIGGAINIVTRSANPLNGNYASPGFSQFYSSAEASSYTRTDFSGWYGATGITGGISYLDVGNLDRGGELGRQPATDFTQYAGDLKLQRMLNSDTMLTVALQHFEQQDLKRSDRFLPFVLGPASNGNVPIQRPTVFDPQQRNLLYARLEGLAADDLIFADAYSFTLSGSRTKEATVVDRFNSNDAGAVPTRREIGEFDDLGWGVIASAVKDAGDFGTISYGTDFYAESIDASRVRIDNPTIPGATAIPDDPQYPDDAEADRVGVYLSWNLPITDRLDATTSVRYENINVSGTPNFETLGPLSFKRSYQDWIASVGLSYLLTEDVRLIGGVYEGFRAPTIDDLTANKVSLQNNVSVPVLGNLDIAPEHSYTYEVGLKFDFDRLRLQAVQFWTDFDSILSRESISGIDFLANRQADINGTELTGEFLITRNLALYGNFSYIYGNFSDDEPISRIPPTQGILGLRFDDPQTRSYFDVFAWMVRRQDRYNAVNLGDVRFLPGGTPGYATLNVRTGRSFGRQNQHHVSLGLENVTDKFYRVLGSGVDGPGFNAIFGYQYQM